MPVVRHYVPMDTHRERLLRLAAAAADERGLSRQSELVKATGLSRSTIHRFKQGEPVSEAALRRISQTLGWTGDSAEAILDGGEPTIVIPPTGEYPPAQDPYQPLAERLPVSVLDELSTGEVYAAEIHDLTVDGGMRIITVAVRHPDAPPGDAVSFEERRRNQRAWSRAQRHMRDLPPLEYEPGDPEEWKNDASETSP